MLLREFQEYCFNKTRRRWVLNLMDADEMRGEESNHRDFGLPLYLCCADRRILLATKQWLKIIFLHLEYGRFLSRVVADREPSLIPCFQDTALELTGAYGAAVITNLPSVSTASYCVQSTFDSSSSAEPLNESSQVVVKLRCWIRRINNVDGGTDVDLGGRMRI